jgi:large conductance mechanosensitive channel
MVFSPIRYAHNVLWISGAVLRWVRFGSQKTVAFLINGGLAMLKEFKDFAIKGNMIDMAVGIIIGAAFGKIIESLVKDVIMPPIGLLMGGVDFSNMFAVLKQGATAGPYATVEIAQKAGAVTWNYGVFINTVIAFLIVAIAIFMLVKAVNKAKKSEPPAPPAPPAEDVVLLREIRDSLKK